MNKVRQANILSLIKESEFDYICEVDELKEKFNENSKKLEQQIRINSGLPDNTFLKYMWYGLNELPFSEVHAVQFDPRLVNVIVPESETKFNISSERRKVVLTLPPLWDGKETRYLVYCASPKAVDYVRILPTPETPFKELEKVFFDDRFFSLPKLKDNPQFGQCLILDKKIIVPESCLEVF